ncbi:hypothetical protein ACM66B_005657 [Microbotryomycetes sp. NB124-2]
MSNQGSGCVTCPTPDLATCSCEAGQPYYFRERTCTQCRQCICQTSSSSTSGNGSKGGGGSAGVTAGAAVGGVLAVAVALFLLYWFWWKPKGLAASRKRYSKHLSNRQSKLAMQLDAHDKKRLSAADALNNRARTDDAQTRGDGVASKRTSVHLSMAPSGDHRLSRRPSPGPREGTLAATGGHSSRTSIDSSNPFGDVDRSSIGTFDDAASAHTSDFSFRSSHSTNIIPIAYIPPHSRSTAVEDADRGAYGEILSDSATGTQRPTNRVPPRISVPTSMASRDSLVLSGGDLIDLHPLPPVLTPGSPVVPLGVSSNGAPIRPPRSPGLDLQLPSPTTSTSAKSSRDSRIGLDLRPKSMSSQSRTASTLLSSGGATAGSPAERTSHLSTISNMSAATSRSGSSTMSYILDPPQIITPVNAQGLKRVEVLGPRQAGLVRIPGSAAGSSASSPAPTSPPASAFGSFASTVTSPATPKAFGAPSVKTPSSPVTSLNPFSDDARVRHSTFSVGEGVTGKATARAQDDEDDDTPMEGLAGALAVTALAENPNPSTWTLATSDSTAERLSTASDTFELDEDDDTTSIDGHVVRLDVQPPSPARSRENAADANSIASTFDVPHSARSSNVFDDADEDAEGSPVSRRLTGESAWAVPAPNGLGASTNGNTSSNALLRPVSAAGSVVSNRSSTATDSVSMLDGIPFMSPTRTTTSTGVSPGGTDAPPSPLFPTPVARAASYISETAIDGPVSGGSNSSSGGPPSPAEEAAPPTMAGQAHEDEDENDPLPAPFLPFAGQRPTSSSSESPFSDSFSSNQQQRSIERDSHPISIRSGFGSGLSSIPFQLDGGLRDSMMTELGAGPSGPGGHGGGGDGQRDSFGATSQRVVSGLVGGVGVAGVGGKKELDDVDEVNESRPTSLVSNASSAVNEDDDDEEDVGEFEVQVATRQPMLARSASVKKMVVANEGEQEEQDPFGEHAEVDQ